MPSLKYLTIAEMEVVASRFLYASANFCSGVYLTTAFSSRQCDDDYRHLTGGLCWRHPRQNSVVSGWFGREITTQHREYNRKRIIEPTEKASAAIITNALFCGWGTVIIPYSGDVKIAGGNGGSLFLSCRRRHARYAWPYRSFPPSCHPPWTFGWTTPRCKERRIKADQNHTP
ncbi:putative mucin-associated surface protein (MASP) [Trypanosoma cruzi]|nr:putative mucin-associated surface protein (MASP) [Trypanosoma cruzi]